MNRIYRLVFNRHTDRWQVVSELARGHCQSSGSAAGGAPDKKPASPTRRALGLPVRTLVAMCGLALAQASLAQVASSQLPTGGSISGGTGTINSPAGATLTIDQTSSRMSHVWSTFDIGSGASVTFNQPATSSAGLSEINGGNPAQIYGTLNANGQVLLSNRNAILFGSTASVNVGGLLATSLGMQAFDFMTGNYALDAGGNAVALVSNRGTMNAASGSVILLGGAVVNQGTITAAAGNLQLIAADRATLTSESGGFNATVTGALQLALNSTAITNTGTLSAPGGRITLQARAATGLFSQVIDNSGTITAAGSGSGNDGSVAFIATGASGATAVTDSGQVDVRDGTISFSTDGGVQQTGRYVAGVLEGSIGGNASFVGTNQIAAIGTMDVSGDLSLRSGRSLVQSGSLNVAGATSIDTGPNAITLDNANNVFGNTVSLIGGNTRIVASNALTLGTLATGNLSATSSGALTLGRGTVTGTLSATSNGGAITQSASNPLTVTGASNLHAGAGAITLTTSGNDFGQAVSLTGGSAAITDANALNLGTLATGNLSATSTGALNLGSGTVTGTLAATSNNGAITQSASTPLTVTATSALNAGTGAITLTTAGNDFGQAVSLTGGSTAIADANVLTLGTLATGNLTATSTGALNLGRGTVTGALAATSNGGAISQSATHPLTVSGTSNLDAGAGSITLEQAGNDFGGAISLTGNGIRLVDGNDLNVAALTLGSNSALSLIAAGTLSLPGNAIDTGSADLALRSGNVLATAGALSGNNVGLRGDDGITLAHDVTAGTLALTTSNSAIAQSAGLLAVSGTGSIDAGTGAIVLTSAGNDFGQAVSLTGGSTAITDVNALTLGTLATGNLTAISSGALNLGSGTVTGTLSGTSNGGTITQTGALAVTGNASLAAGTGIDLTNAGNDFRGTLSLTGTTVRIADSNNLSLGAINASGALGLAVGGTATTTAALTAATVAVDAGTLRVNHALTTSSVQVAPGAAIGGTGTISGAVAVAAGGTLKGTSGQTLTMGSLTLDSGAAVEATLGTPGAAQLFQVHGALTLDGSLTVNDMGGFSAGVYRLFNYSGALTDNGLDIGTSPSGSTLAVQTASAGVVNLVNTSGQTLNFWDGNATGAADNGAIDGGNGTWTATSTHWTTADGLVNASMAPMPGFAIFQGTPGTVTVSGAPAQVSVTGMQFASNGYRLQGDAIALSGSRAAIRVGDGSSAGAGYTATISNALTGTAQLEKTDAGTLVLTGTNTYAGGTLVSGGTLVGGIRSFGTGAIENHGALVIDEASDGVFSNTLSGDGSLSKTGVGQVRYDGDGSAFTGSLKVDGGAFSVNGALGGHVLIGSGGILKGTGTVGSTTLAAGATAAPGNSIGTLRVAGNLVFQAGSAYQVEVDAAGSSDRIDVTGTAALGGATVNVLAADGSWNAVTRYTILRADGGLLGSFGTPTSNLAFLTPSLTYGAQEVTLTLARNDVAFQQVGTSANQRSTGQAVERLPAGSIYDAVLRADAATARTAFDRLSGELHATVRSGLIEDSRFVRDASLARLQQDGDSAMAANDLRASQDVAGDGVWVRAYDGHGRAAGDGNAARADRSASGVLVGADRRVGDWRVGVMGGAGHDKTDISDRDSHASIDSYHLGVYGGRRWGDLALRTGVSYTRHDIETRRHIAFGSFTDTARADSHADTAQAYGELGWRLRAGSVELEPFASLAHVRLHTGNVDERGGSAALQGRGETTGTTFSTLGLRAGQRFDLGRFQLTARGMLGWQRAYGDVTPQASLAFDGGSAFTASGVPVARNTLVAEAGVDVQLKRSLTLGVAYAGQRGDGVRSHGLKADLRWRF